MTRRWNFRVMLAAAVCVWCHISVTAPAQPSLLPDDEVSLSAILDEALREADEAQGVFAEKPEQARRLFLSAAKKLRRIVDAGVINGHLEYNLGNCYLQVEDIGRAILHYRRAQRLIPNDALLENNLSLARSRRLTSISPTPQGELLRTLLFVHYQLAQSHRTMLAMALYILAWVLLALRLWRPRRWLVVTCGVSFFLAASFTISVAVEKWKDRRTPDGVITAMDVTVYSGPKTTYDRQFEQPLQPGVEFTQIEQRGDWWNIRLPDGQTGWIQAEKAELVPWEAAASRLVIAPARNSS